MYAIRSYYDNVIPYNQRRSEGVVQRHGPEGLKAANFPEHWMRDYDPVDKYTGWFPDMPNKDAFMKKIQAGAKKGEEVLQQVMKEAQMEEAKKKSQQ